MEHWLFNTDETEPEGEGKYKKLIRQRVVAAWGSCKGLGAEVTLNRPRQGDWIYFFRAGYGIIARAQATEVYAAPSRSIFNEAGEYCRPVDSLQVLPESMPITVASIKENSGYQIPYRQVMGRILNKAAQDYLEFRFGSTETLPKKPLSKPKPGSFSFFQPDPELRKKVERSAIRFVKAKYRKEKWSVKSVERENVGYDLHCTKGSLVECVEVKGATGNEQQIVLTANEIGKAQTDNRFVLYVITNALIKPTAHRYSGSQLMSGFDIQPIQYRAKLK